MTGPVIPIGTDGFYHPCSEEEIIALVHKAAAEGLQIRVRGAAHSIAHAIYTNPGPGDPPVPNKVSEQKPPQGPNLNLMLNGYRQLTWIDEEQGIVEVEAGLNLGVDPYDPTKTSTPDNGLLYQAWQKGWTLCDLGGITHQTVSGFFSTGSAGGSLTYSLNENLLAFRIVDAGGLKATGAYATEIYAATASDFWLDPSYKQPMIRIDVFWFSKNAGDPAIKGGFFEQFWQLLKPFGFRLHWGKFLPEYDYPEWVQYYHEQLPRLQDFLALRERMDPQNLFLTDYWKRHLYGGVETRV
jgi:FAD/FMN-containing dehydrogenase